MKHRILVRILAVVMAFSLVSTSFAANATHTDLSGTVTEGDVEVFFGGAETGVTEGTVSLTQDVTVSTDNGEGMAALVINPGVNFDLGGYTLTVEKGEKENPVEEYGVPTSGVVTTGHNNISNGKIEVGEGVDVGIWETRNQASLDGVEMEANSGETTLIHTNDGVTLTDCTLDASKVVDGDGDSKNITFVSGVYDNLSDVLNGENKNYKLDNGSSEYTVSDTPGQDDPSGQPVEPTNKPTVIVSKDTAAVVVDKDGNVKLYDSLDDATEAVGTGAVVNVLKDTDVPDGFKVENGKLVEDKKEPVNPNPPGPGTVEPPVIVPGIEGPGLMDDPTVEIDDPDVPLASGPVTRAQFVDYLWRYDGQKNAAASTFADVAEDHEYADAIGWAQANGLILGDENNDFAPDELVTVSAVRTILTRYAKWKEMVMPELTTLTGADDAAVLNCDEVLAEFFGE